MRIIKRSGEEQEFNPKKISVAIGKANGSVTKDKQFPENYIPAYTAQAVAACENLGHTPTVQEVQDIVENVLMDSGYHEVARAYIKYRYTHDAMRQHNTTDDRILSLIEYKNEEVKQENSNKNPQVVSVQRDYMTGDLRFLVYKKEVHIWRSSYIRPFSTFWIPRWMPPCSAAAAWR